MNTITPIVSVVVPCYNQAQYLPEVVESVVNQTYRCWELIIVNDGSPDQTSAVTLELIQQYPGRHIRLVEKPNGGLSSARNAGVRASSGKYWLPLDADDKIAPTFLEKAVEVLENRPEIGFVYSHIQHFGAQNETYYLPEFDADTIVHTDNIGCVSSLVRRTVWEEVGGYQADGYEDWDFWIGCIEKGWKGYRIPEVLFWYRKKEQSYLTDSNEIRAKLRANITLRHPNLYHERVIRQAEQILQDEAASGGSPKVLILCSHFWPSVGGLETISENLGNQLVKLGFGVDVATWARADRTFYEYRGMQILSLEPARMVDNVPVLFYQVKQLVESGDYQACIVLADPLNLMIWALEAVKIPKQTRVIIQPIINQDGYQRWKGNREFRLRLAGILRRADAALALTRKGTEVAFMRQEGIKPVYLPNAVAAPFRAAGDFRKEYNLPENEFLILHVANLYAVKNHTGLLQALRDIPEDWKLVMIGHPSGEPETVARFYQELSRHPRVLYIPGLPPERTAAAMQAADVVLLASKGEVSPVTILEAMSHRKPWLATPDCGAVVDHAGGIVVPLENFRDVLQVLKDCPDLRHELGELGYRHIQSSYSWPAVIQGWEELIENGRMVSTFEMPESISSQMDLLRKQVEQKVGVLCSSLPTAATPGQPGKHKAKASQKKRPLVSVIIPTCNRPRELMRAVESVVSQTYPNLEIIIVNDGKGDLKPVMKRFQNRRPVRLISHQQNRGAGAARNTGMRAARGEYIAFLDDDDIYYPEHIRTLAGILESEPALVAAYADAIQTTLDMTGEEPTPLEQAVVFSSDFSPERFLVCNYIPILCLMLRRSILEKVGFFDEMLPALEDWEWLIRLARAGNFRHAPVATAEYFIDRGSKSRNSLSLESLGELYAEIYSRCASFTSPEVFEAQCQFYAQITQNRSLAEVLRDGQLNRFVFDEFQKPGEAIRHMEAEKEYLVDIVIPVYGQVGLVKACVDSLLRTVSGARLILVDDCSPDQAAQSLLSSYSRLPQVTVARNAQNQGFIGTTRHGAQLGQAPYILFLNSDTEAIEAGWLEKLIPTDEQIAIVGAKLLYPLDLPDMRAGTVQHAGVARNPDLIPYHPFLGWPGDSPESNLRREVNAVTGACLLIRRKVWDEIGGWDDRFGRGVYEDVDLCWQARQHGYRVLYQPEGILYHRESASIDPDGSHNLHAHSKENVEKLIEKWCGLRSDEAIFYGTKAYQRMEQGRRWIRKAEQALARGDLKTAFSTVGRAVKEAPQLTSALTSYARLLSRRGEHFQAAEYIERALKQAPHNWQLHLFLMEEWISAGELSRAVSVLDELMRVFPNEPGLQKRKQVMAGWLSKSDGAPSSSYLPDEPALIAPDLPALDRSQALLASLLDAEDLIAALQEHAGELDEDLLALVQDNAAAARAGGDLELSEGLEDLAAYIEQAIVLRQPQEN